MPSVSKELKKQEGKRAVRKCRGHADVRRRGELHPLICLAIDTVCHDCGCGGMSKCSGVVRLSSEEVQIPQARLKFLAAFCR